MNFIKILHLTAPLIGSVAVLIGLLAIFSPKKMSVGFGIPIEGTALQYVVGLGVRDIFIGLAVLIMYSQSSWSSLAWLSFAIAFVAASDFIIVYKNGDKKTSCIHFAGAVCAVLYGTLLFQFT